MARMDRLMVPAINGRNYVIKVRADFDSGQAQGAVLAFGNRFGGIALYCANGQLVFDYIYSEAKTHRLALPLPLGQATASVEFRRSGERSGSLTLAIAGAHVSLEVPWTWTTYGITAGLTCGYLNVPIVPECPLPGVFTGQLDCVELALLDQVRRDAGGFEALVEQE